MRKIMNIYQLLTLLAVKSTGIDAYSSEKETKILR